MNNLAGSNIPFCARQPTSIIPLKSPCFSIHHYQQPCSSGYQNRAPSVLPGGKRKSSSESMFHPLTKQQITEARIASSMQRLSLDNSYQNSDNLLSGSDRTQDEGFFEEMSNLDCDDNDVLPSSNDHTRLPQFKLSADIKEGFDEMLNGILPHQIYKSVNQSCLALIPYVPPTDSLLMAKKREEEESENERGASHMPSDEEMRYEDSEELMCIDVSRPE